MAYPMLDRQTHCSTLCPYLLANNLSQPLIVPKPSHRYRKVANHFRDSLYSDSVKPFMKKGQKEAIDLQFLLLPPPLLPLILLPVIQNGLSRARL